MRGTSLGRAIHFADIRLRAEYATARASWSIIALIEICCAPAADIDLATERSVSCHLVVGDKPTLGRQFKHVGRSHQQDGFPAKGEFPRERLFTDAVCVLTEQSVIACAAIHAIQ